MFQITTTIAIFLVLLLGSIALFTEFLKSGELPTTMTGAFAKIKDTLTKLFFKQNLTRVEFSLRLEEGSAEVRGEGNLILTPCDFVTLEVGRSRLFFNSTIGLEGFKGELKLKDDSLNLSGRFKLVKFGTGNLSSSDNLRLATCFRRLDSNWSKGYLLLRGVTGSLKVGDNEFMLKNEQVEVRNFFGVIDGINLTEISGASELVRIGTKVTIS